MSKWWAPVEPVTVEVSCGEERHRLSWRRGKLVLDDHDLAAEESFAALGGEPALCLEVLRAWRAGVDDRHVLWFWDAPLVTPDMAKMLAAMRERHQRVLASQRQMVATGNPNIRLRVPGPVPPAIMDRVRADLAAEYRRSLLSALPEDLRLRLGLSAVVRARRRQSDRAWFAARSSDLQTALSGRASPAVETCMRAWRGRLAAHHLLTVECWVVGPGEPATLCGLMDDAGGWAAACLPLGWLVDVWARGIALVEGCFVLEVRSADPSGLRLSVTAARWERRLPAGSTPVLEPAIVVPGSDGRWCLRWDG